MRIVCISDTHSLHDHIEVPNGDILIHAGDFSRKGQLKDLHKFNKWLGKLPHEHKVVIAGNHDFCFERDYYTSKSFLSNALYLQDSGVEIEGLFIYGSPWQPRFYDWAFNLDRGEQLRRVWERIPDHTDILVTHGPPFGFLDRCDNGRVVGCEDLLERIEELPNLKLHVFGHIHSGHGTCQYHGITLVNASICDDDYTPSNFPVIVDI